MKILSCLNFAFTFTILYIPFGFQSRACNATDADTRVRTMEPPCRSLKPPDLTVHFSFHSLKLASIAFQDTEFPSNFWAHGRGLSSFPCLPSRVTAFPDPVVDLQSSVTRSMHEKIDIEAKRGLVRCRSDQIRICGMSIRRNWFPRQRCSNVWRCFL